MNIKRELGELHITKCVNDLFSVRCSAPNTRGVMIVFYLLFLLLSPFQVSVKIQDTFCYYE